MGRLLENVNSGAMTFDAVYSGQCHVFLSLSLLYMNIDLLMHCFLTHNSCFIFQPNEGRKVIDLDPMTSLIYHVHIGPMIWSHSFMAHIHRSFLCTDRFLLQRDWHLLRRNKIWKMLRFLWRCREAKYISVELCFKWLQPNLARWIFDHLTGQFVLLHTCLTVKSIRSVNWQGKKNTWPT